MTTTTSPRTSRTTLRQLAGQVGAVAADVLDNLGHPSARDIVPELQQLEIGQWMP